MIPAAPTAIEFKLGTDRRFVQLRILGWTGDIIPCHTLHGTMHQITVNTQQWKRVS